MLRQYERRLRFNHPDQPGIALPDDLFLNGQQTVIAVSGVQAGLRNQIVGILERYPLAPAQIADDPAPKIKNAGRNPLVR